MAESKPTTSSFASSEDLSVEKSFKDQLLEKSYSQRKSTTNYDGAIAKIAEYGAGLMSEQFPSFTDPVCFNNATFSDVQLRINGDDSKVYSAHKVILIARSEYFKTLFLTGKAWNENKTGIVDLTVEETNMDIFEEFLSYFYSGQIGLTKDRMWPLYFLSDQYLMEGLKTLVKDFVQSTILNNAIDEKERCYEVLPFFSVDEAIDIALYFDDWDIKCSAGCIILTNIDGISQLRFNTLPKEVLQVLLNAKTLKPKGQTSNNQSMPNRATGLFGGNGGTQPNQKPDTVGPAFDEYALFRKMVTWLDTNPNRGEFANDVLKHIRFGRFKSLSQLREASRNKYIANSDKLSPLISIVVQEISFAGGQNRPKASQLEAYEGVFPDKETLCNLFKSRVANEQLPFTNQ